VTQDDHSPVEGSQAADPATNQRGASEATGTESASVRPSTRPSDEEITAKLNQVLAGEDGLDPVIRRLQAKSIGPSDW